MTGRLCWKLLWRSKSAGLWDLWEACLEHGRLCIILQVCLLIRKEQRACWWLVVNRERKKERAKRAKRGRDTYPYDSSQPQPTSLRGIFLPVRNCNVPIILSIGGSCRVVFWRESLQNYGIEAHASPRLDLAHRVPPDLCIVFTDLTWRLVDSGSWDPAHRLIFTLCSLSGTSMWNFLPVRLRSLVRPRSQNLPSEHKEDLIIHSLT